MSSTNAAYYLQSLDRLVRSPGFFTDLTVLAGIDEEVFACAEQKLREHVGFLDSETARKQLAGIVSEEIAGTIWNFARNLGVLRSKIGCSADELANHFHREIERFCADAEGAQVTAEVLAAIRTRLGKLAEPIRGIEQQMKAVALAQSTGSMLRDVAVVCDIRPVFDEGRSKIEGLFPVATLQLTFETLHGLEKVETVLSPQQVEMLADVALTAKRKMDSIRQLTTRCVACDIGVPEVWES